MLSLVVSRTGQLRCVVFVAWGDAFISAVEECLARSPGLEGYPVYVITDLETKTPEEAPFTVVRANFKMSGHFRKSEVRSYLPPGFHSYLLLDTDTTVLGDLTFGFEKAELHGIAMAHAPVYLMERFDQFPGVMKAEGVPFQNQPLFNSGVIFLKLDSCISKVLDEWSATCQRWSDKPVRKTDQPYLSLALETQGVVPYTLVRNFNFRPHGEAAFLGEIIVWHSRIPAPSNLNENPSSWRTIDLLSGKVRYFRRQRSMRQVFKSAKRVLRRTIRNLRFWMAGPHQPK